MEQRGEMSEQPGYAAAPGRTGGSVAAIAAVAVLLLAEAGAVFWTVTSHAQASWITLTGTALAWLLSILAAAALRKAPARAVPAVVLAGALLLGAAALAAPPSTSNDSARYAWDGIVQISGDSPYTRVPADSSNAALRPDWLFAQPGADGTCSPGLFPTGTETTTETSGGATLCTAINRPQVHTIYPAVAELYFAGVRLVVPAGVGFVAFQAAGAAIALAVTFGLLMFFRRSGLPAYRTAWWAFSPLVVFEAINNAHVDVLGSALLLVAVLALARGRVLGSGLAFGAAVATKLIPAIAAPALLYRRPVRFVLAAVAAFVVSYVPYVLSSGWAVIGFLPGYLKEEGYNSKSTSRFELLRIFLPDNWDLPVGLVLLAVLSVYCLLRVDRSRPWNTQLLMIT
ncbi:MAG TPA: glycosyltransferase 87 family protein, partial [Micrococcaceae bacterium]